MISSVVRSLLRAAFPPAALLRLGALLALLVATGGFVASGPWSPTALGQVRSEVAEGDITAALHTCRQVARYNPLPSLRQEARFQSAVLSTTIVGDHRAAARDLWWVIQRAPEGAALRRQAMELLAPTLSQELRHPAHAAVVYERLAHTWPEHQRADSWLLAAAQARESAGQDERARLLRARIVVSGGPLVAAAWLEMARTSLAQGLPSRAYDEYRRAKESSRQPEVQRLARIGTALALEDLGQMDAAVAELDEDDLPDDEALNIARERLIKRVASGPARR